MSRTISNPQMVLRPQDVVVLLRLSLVTDSAPTYAAMAQELKLTASEIHACAERAVAAQLARKDDSGKPVVLLEPMRLFVQHGVRYCFPVTHGPLGRGMPTAHAAAPLNQLMVQSTDPVPVWPHKDGKVRGMAFYPLYPTVPDAAQKNPALYELLALVDAVRGGNMRERALAIAELDKRWAHG
jgi:hypothetical protein